MSLNPKQRRAAELLALGYTQADAAKRAGCSERSIRRWNDENPDFQQAASASTDEISDQSPIEVLRSLLSSDRDDLRLRAASRLHEIEVQSATPDNRGATIYVHVARDGTAVTHEVSTVQRDLPPGSHPWLVLHLESAPLQPMPFDAQPDAVRYPPLSEDAH